MRIRFSSAAVAAVVAVAVVPGAAMAATVTVRVEGANGTLLPRTQVTTSPDPVPGGDHCAGNTVAGALDVATHGNWDQKSFTQTILGETHAFANSDYWAEWLDYKFGGGICNDVVHDGDEVLMLVDVSSSSFLPTVFPLRIQGVPASVQTGVPFTVTVVKYTTDGTPGTGTPVPEAGAVVTGAGTAATTDAAGHATVSIPAAGSFTLRATKPGDAPSAAEPVEAFAPGTAPPAVPAPKVDKTAPVASIAGIRSHQRFRRGHGPRRLDGTATDSSGLRDVELRLTRRRGGRCYAFSDRRARFVRASCGIAHAAAFSVGAKASWSYLLPARLGPGDYVLAVTATDAAGNVAHRHVLFAVRSRA